MTATNTPTPAHEAVLTDDDLRNSSPFQWLARRYGDDVAARMLRENERLVLSKLRAPVADEQAPYTDTLSDFKEGQWWVKELDLIAAYNTGELKRAVAVVHRMLRAAALASAPTAEPFDAEVLAERLRDVAANHFEAALGFGITQDHFERCAREAAKVAQAMASAPVAGGKKPSAAAFARTVLARYGYTPLPIADVAPQASEADRKEAAAMARSLGAPDMADALDPSKDTDQASEVVRDAGDAARWRAYATQFPQVSSVFLQVHGDPAPQATQVVRQDRSGDFIKLAEAIVKAHESMFAQCCSNPVRNAWGVEVNMLPLNQAYELARAALSAQPEQS